MDSFNLTDVSHSEKLSKEEKTVYKRRSSVFQSRVIAFDEHEENEESVDNNDARGCTSKISQEETFNLEEYVNSLRNERKKWIETIKERKNERRKLAKQKLRLESQGQPLDLTVLSDSEKAFVSARPKYEHIYRNNKKLTEITLKVSLLNQMVYRLNQRFILQMEKRLGKATKKVIESSEP